MQQVLNDGNTQVQLAPGATLIVKAIGGGSYAILSEVAAEATVFFGASTSGSGIAKAGPFALPMTINVEVRGSASLEVLSPSVASLVSGAGNSGRSASNTVVLFGDSITNNNNANNGASQQVGNVTYQDRLQDVGYFTWTNILLNGAFTVLRNSGIAGDTTGPGAGSLGNMLSRIDADVLAYKPRYCVVMAGINDLNLGFSAASITANLETIYTRLRQSGIIVIACTVLPNNAINALGAGNAKVEAFAQVNAWVRRYGAVTDGIIVVDTFSALYDPATICGAVAGSFVDQTHPGTIGANRVGVFLAAALQGVVKASPVVASLGDLASATNPLGNLINFPVMTGTGGQLPSANTTPTGTMATGWWLQDLNTAAGGSTVTFTRPARTDKPGKAWFQSALTWNATQAAVATWSHRLFSASALPAGVSAGDTVDLAWEINYLNPVNAGGVEVFLDARDAGSATLATAQMVYSQSPTTPEPTFSGVVRIRDFVLPPGTASLMLKFVVRNLAGTVGGCTVQFGDVEVRKRAV